MKPKIIYLFILSASLVSFLFYSCGEGIDTTSPPTNDDCGPHHAVHYGTFFGGEFTYTFLTGNIRTFQYSGIPFTTITNVCTKNHPSLVGHAQWEDIDTSRRFTAKLHVDVNPLFAGYTSSGTTTPGITSSWEANIPIGLQSHYGDGPGEIIDMRVDITFITLGSRALDSAFIKNRFSCDMDLNYDEYRAP